MSRCYADGRDCCIDNRNKKMVGVDWDRVEGVEYVVSRVVVILCGGRSFEVEVFIISVEEFREDGAIGWRDTEISSNRLSGVNSEQDSDGFLIGGLGGSPSQVRVDSAQSIARWGRNVVKCVLRRVEVKPDGVGGWLARSVVSLPGSTDAWE